MRSNRSDLLLCLAVLIALLVTVSGMPDVAVAAHDPGMALQAPTQTPRPRDVPTTCTPPWCSPQTPILFPPLPLPKPCGNCNGIGLLLYDSIRDKGEDWPRGMVLQFPFDTSNLEPETQLAIIRIDLVHHVPKVAAVMTVGDLAADATILNLGEIPETAPSGAYVVTPCGENCDSPDAVIAQLENDSAPWTSFVIPAKTNDFGVAVIEDGNGHNRYLDVNWSNEDLVSGDRVDIEWYKNANMIASLSGANPLQSAFGYLDPNQDGTRLYNTHYINVAPLVPDILPGLAVDMPPGAYEVRLFVNDVLEGSQVVQVAP